MSDPYRHPADRTCQTTATMLAALGVLTAALIRKAVRR